MTTNEIIALTGLSLTVASAIGLGLWRVAVWATAVRVTLDSLSSTLGLIESNHLPHLEQEIGELKDRLSAVEQAVKGIS